jgi:hypothetical protein
VQSTPSTEPAKAASVLPVTVEGNRSAHPHLKNPSSAEHPRKLRKTLQGTGGRGVEGGKVRRGTTASFHPAPKGSSKRSLRSQCVAPTLSADHTYLHPRRGQGADPSPPQPR